MTIDLCSHPSDLARYVRPESQVQNPPQCVHSLLHQPNLLAVLQRMRRSAPDVMRQIAGELAANGGALDCGVTLALENGYRADGADGDRGQTVTERFLRISYR